MKGHPEPEALSSLLDRQAVPDKSRELRRHLSECAHCRQEAEEMARINMMLSNWFESESVPEPPPLALPPAAAPVWQATVVRMIVFLLLAVLSYAAWHQFAFVHSGILEGLKQLAYDHLAYWLGRVPAAAAHILFEPAVVHKVLWRGLLECSGLAAALGMIYAMQRNVRTGRTGRTEDSLQTAGCD